MGFFSDMLKGLPENAVLRQKNADLEAKNAALDTEVAILKDQLREAQGKTTKLEKRIEQLTHIELDELEIKILILIANAIYSEPSAADIAEMLQIHNTVAQHHLDRLYKAGCVSTHLDREFYAMQVYELTAKGRQFLVQNNLIG